MAKMVKISVSVDEAALRRAKAQAKVEGVSVSALLMRGLQHELDSGARLDAGLELYGRDGWPAPDERRRLVDSWTGRAPKQRAKRKAA